MTNTPDSPLKKAVTHKTKRDRSLDFLKGFACIQMLIAHSTVLFFDTPGALWVRVLSGYATIIFFGISGITALIQIKHYGLKATLSIYIWLYILGVSMVFLVFHTENLDHFFLIEILQIIALGCIMLILIEHFIKPNRWGYLAIALFFIALKFIIDAWGAGQLQPWPLPRALVTTIPGLLRYDFAYNPNFYPGFTLIPWLWVFPFCIFVRRSTPRFNLTGALVCVLALAVMYYSGMELQLHNKWNAPVEYFIALAAYTMFQFGLLHANSHTLIQRLPVWIETLGKDVLLFLYVHFAGVFFGSMLAIFLFQGGWALLPNHQEGLFYILFPTLTTLTRQYVAWVFNLSIALAILWAVKKIPLSSLFDQIYSWYLVAFLIWLIPIIVPAPPAVWFLELFLGVTYVLHFPKLTALLRQRALQANLSHNKVGANT